MKTGIFFIFCIALFLSKELGAQTVRVINSTEQRWSGGVAGRTGVNYSFVIEFSKYKQEPLPDTLWIGQEPIAILITDSSFSKNINTKRTCNKHTVRFEINVGTSHDENTDRFPVQEKPTVSAHPPMKYKGAALLSYLYNGKQCYYEISKFLKVYPPLSYP